MTLAELWRKLMFHNIPLDEWNRPGKKSLEELHRELVTGDSRLIESGGRLIRRVECAAVDVFYVSEKGRLYLKETHQVVNGDKRIRKLRKGSILEKRRPDEAPLECAHRGLLEELGITQRLELISSPIDYSEGASRSFPGLHHSYVFYPFDVYLPEGWYKPEGYVDMSEAPREITYFAWM